MENQSHKGIGIAIGTLVVIAVVFITVFSENKPSVVPPDNQIQNPNNTVPGNNTPAVSNTPPTNPVADNKPQTPPIKQTPPVKIPPIVKIPIVTTVYKNGSYSATGSYQSPGGYDQLGVSLTIQNDKVTSLSVTNMAGDRRSQRYEDMFISGVNQYVVGQSVDSIYLTRVSGSSLTPMGFNDALDQIKAQAKV